LIITKILVKHSSLFMNNELGANSLNILKNVLLDFIAT
jgi:hypothetical protein